MEQKMQLCSHPNAHQNVILCFMGCALCLFLQVKERNTEVYLHETYPGVTKIIYLPSSFSFLVKYFQVEKSMSRYSHYHFLLSRQLTEFFCNNLGRYEFIEDHLFPTISSVVSRAKEDWKINRWLRLIKENYLGGSKFDAKLKRSCSKFYHELKKVPGCYPIQWYSIN